MIKKLIAYLILFIIFGCKAIEANKDNKAYLRVIGSDQLSEKAYERLSKSHPCATDSSISIIPGIPDTVTQVYIDTLLPVDGNGYLNSDTVFRIRYVPKVIFKTSTVTKVDTVLKTVNVSRNYKDISDQFALLNGKYDQQSQQLATTQSKSNRKTWWMIGEGLLILLLLIIIIKKFL